MNKNEIITILKACLELLERQENSSIVLNLLEETVVYHGAECDGSCLMDDIKLLLEELEDN
jgi:hypothetical protein